MGAPVLAGAEIFGIAIGLAAKETLADILSGIYLIADRPIRIGDRIIIDNVCHRRANYCRLRTFF
jgi:small-conductance mechanosensitive channel